MATGFRFSSSGLATAPSAVRASRKGVIALRQLVDALAAGSNVLITPDGPRGPRLSSSSPGIIFVAQKSGAAIVPMHLEYSERLAFEELGSFLRAQAVFDQCASASGAPQRVERTTRARRNSRTERLRIQNAMMNLVEEK